ncbi:MAG TPA: cytochrome c, partial [Terriglobales bacterium]|nr:cytochrome c [Terriglobales bacterium]
SFHSAAIREAPIGHFYDVITNGFGAMPDYASQVPPRDRWAIAAYIRALQLSQHAGPQDLPPGQELPASVPVLGSRGNGSRGNAAAADSPAAPQSAERKNER